MKYKQKTNIEVRVRDISTSFMLYVSFDDKGTGHHEHSMYLHLKSRLVWTLRHIVTLNLKLKTKTLQRIYTE